jgi:CheY-like chemotaxis protein
VLVVEDELAIRVVLSRLLRRRGYEVTAKSNGEDAMEHLEAEGGPDLLLTDISMPGMLGTELATTVSERWPDVTIVLMTGYADEDAVSLGRPIIRKPFEPAALLSQLDEALG